MLANALIIVGVVTGLLGILDEFILSETQKTHLSDRCVALWNFLDDARNGSFYEFLRRKFVRILSVLGGAVFMAWGFVVSFIEGTVVTFKVEGVGDIEVSRDTTLADIVANWTWFLFGFVLLSVAGLLSNILLTRLLSEHPRVSFLKASTIAIFLYVSGVIALELISVKWLRIYYPETLFDVVATVTHVIFGAVGFVLIFPLVVFYSALLLLYVVEFLVRRIAEQPKGPLAAFSALMTALGGILKVFE